ncbi:MAG: hypothetical protein AB7D28_00705 [Candidatus Berkiella sp.]
MLGDKRTLTTTTQNHGAIDLKSLLLQAKDSFRNQQYQSAANDYLVALERLTPSSLSQTTEAKKKREFYRQVQSWLCDCYLQLNAPLKILEQLSPSAEYTSINSYYLRARAYVLLDKIPEAIGELIYCHGNDEQGYDLKWIESNLLLATLYIQQHDTQAGYTQLQFCQNTLTRWRSNGAIGIIHYLNSNLEIQYHLCQLHRMNKNIDAAIQALKNAYQLYLSVSSDELENDNNNVHPLLVSIISQLFLLLMEKREWSTAFTLLNDLSLFEKTAHACATSAQTKVLTMLLVYAKHSYESGNHPKAAEAFRISLSYMGAASRLENKSMIVFSLVFAANFYLLPESHNTEFALQYIQLAFKRLDSISPQEERDIIHLELLLLQLVALQYQGDADKSILCFNDLIALYSRVKLNSPQKCEALLRSTLTLFAQSKIGVFSDQINVLAHELEKYQLENLSLAILSSLTTSSSTIQDEAQDYSVSTLSISAEPICFSKGVVVATKEDAISPEPNTNLSFNKDSFRR